MIFGVLMLVCALTQMELDRVEKATRWISLRDTGEEYLRGFVLNSISDTNLALKVASLSEDEFHFLIVYLRSRRRK